MKRGDVPPRFFWQSLPEGHRATRMEPSWFLTTIARDLPSGKRLHSEVEHHRLKWVNQL